MKAWIAGRDTGDRMGVVGPVAQVVAVRRSPVDWWVWVDVVCADGQIREYAVLAENLTHPMGKGEAA